MTIQAEEGAMERAKRRSRITDSAAEGSARLAVKRIGIVYQERTLSAAEMAVHLAARLREQREVWSMASQPDHELRKRLEGTDVIIVLGGDGTILSVARDAAISGVPLLAVNFGRVGFLTELEPHEVERELPFYFEGDYWVDERAMLQATLEANGSSEEFLALNDIVVVRGALPRVVRIKVWVDGHYYNTTVADGMIVSTATGSTAYNLAAGGPVLYPKVRGSVITPIAPHLAADRSLILDSGVAIKLQIITDGQDGVLSADGQINRNLQDGAIVSVTNSRHVTRFLRRRPPTYFYQILTHKLQTEV
jgi:NAD+ kinase